MTVAHHLRVRTVALAEVALTEALLTHFAAIRTGGHDHARTGPGIGRLDIDLAATGEVAVGVTAVST